MMLILKKMLIKWLYTLKKKLVKIQRDVNSAVIESMQIFILIIQFVTSFVSNSNPFQYKT